MKRARACLEQDQVLSSNWSPPLLKGVVQAVPCPMDRTRTGVLTARHLAIVRGTDHLREALEVLRHLTGPAAAAYAQSIGAFPCSADWGRGRFDGYPELRNVFESAMACARTLPNLPVMATLEWIFERSMERLVRSVLHGTYQTQALREELLYAKAEMDYVLMLQQGRTI